VARAGQLWVSATPVDRAGREVFNNTNINITGVSGLNDDLNLPGISGFCGTCHDTPKVGNHSVKAPLDIGIPDAGAKSPPVLDISGLPVFHLKCTQGALAVKYTVTDPGRALITGQCKDIGRFKGPILRGLAGRFWWPVSASVFQFPFSRAISEGSCTGSAMTSTAKLGPAAPSHSLRNIGLYLWHSRAPGAEKNSIPNVNSITYTGTGASYTFSDQHGWRHVRMTSDRAGPIMEARLPTIDRNKLSIGRFTEYQ
jgi:hypothetical protein